MLQPQIVKKPALTVVGLEAPFLHALSPEATNFQVIGALWGQFMQRISEAPNRSGDATYGIVYGRPESERSHPDELQYIAGAPVSSIADIPQGMVSKTVPAGTFAVFIHRGPISGIADTCQQIYRDWLPQAGYKHAGTADVELYDHRFCPDGDDSEMEYWVSVIPKGA